MTLNFKTILSAVGVAALLASPAMAKTQRHQHKAPTMINVPADAQASVNPYAPAVTVYAPDLKVQAHPSINGLNPDFQLGSDR
jgi:hypothetical protein